jgi:hypothetical protein
MIKVAVHEEEKHKYKIQQDEKNQSSKTSIERDSCSVPFDDGDHYCSSLNGCSCRSIAFPRGAPQGVIRIGCRKVSTPSPFYHCV